ncbi:NADP-dependent L-serine/L-allo-threonine dehydrogenase YdfG [Candidatus Zixiibacteriota bacterium]|nr:NADP-dependent L-serine/L-allo-threonine dehydrogenase YdfG [candidate division Zixibacteria bacterium]
MKLLANRIAFITGASAGIGEATAHCFAQNGADLILAARRLDRVEKLAAELKDKYQIDIHTFQLDVRHQPEVEKKIGGLPEKWQKIDILVNNAGLSRGLEKLHEGKLSDWEEMIDTNVKGLLYVSRAVIPGMVARGKGDIVNIGSIAGHEVYPGGNVYCASKFAVDALTKGMQIDLVDTPLRVSTVDPGMVETEFSMVRFHGDKERATKVYQNLAPLTGADIAEAILFCVTRPPHVNIHQVRIMPTCQAAAMVVSRKG